MKKLHIIALAAHGVGLSGGDRIFIELARRWSKQFSINIYVTSEGMEMCKRQNLFPNKNLNFKVVDMGVLRRFGFLGSYISRIVEGIKLGFSIQLTSNTKPHTTIYNASEFWMDSLPCAILKLRFPMIKWIATWYQTAPNPLKGYEEQVSRKDAYKLSALMYWLAQLPVKPLINKLADKVIVNNEDERKRFPGKKTIVLIGAVPLGEIKNWQEKNKNIKKEFEGVFQGRLHPQKGVLELIDIWNIVVREMPKAKLGIIGDGPLMDDVKKRISNYKLDKNVKLFGYVFDGHVKYKLFSSGKVVLHPALYDSGGMASAEAMAFGLPCVGFDLVAYKSYYPKGMIKVPTGDKNAFASEILKLLNNKEYYSKYSREATNLIESSWSWDKRAMEILEQIEK